jgi:hypothetical protein
MDRRKFLISSSVMTFGLGLAPVRSESANEIVNIGAIGRNGMGFRS